jgi:outer membrane protein assembly factor BamD
MNLASRLRSRRALAALAALIALAALTACKGGRKEDPILALSAAESLAQGKQLVDQEKYSRARPYLLHAFEVEPNSTTGREALLLAADTYYLEGGRSNYIQAEAKYKDFLNRFPTSERASYAQFQIAGSLAQRMEKPDRDQSTARQALDAYEELVRLYPTSEQAAQAREQIKVVRDHLAEHELLVGRFYLRYRIPIAAVGRFEYLLDTYPDYGEKDKALFYLGEAYRATKRIEDAIAAFERLRREYPDSPYVDDIPHLEPPPPQKAEEAEPAGKAPAPKEKSR